MKRVIIDTDPGIDDAAAIFLALGSPELQVDALTTVFGNTAVEQCTVNALRILEAAGRADIPVYQGSGRPFNFGAWYCCCADRRTSRNLTAFSCHSPF